MADNDKNKQSPVDTGNQLLKKNAYIESISLSKQVRGSAAQFDLMSCYTLVQLHESIEDKFVTGMLMFEDNGKIFDETPFVGDETVTIKVRSLKTGQTFERTFVCHAYKPMANDDKNSSTVLVTIHFHDKNIDTLYKEFSISFKEEKISDFIEKFCKKNFVLPQLTIENTDKKMSLAFPYQKFHYILKYLVNYAKNSKGDGRYVFFSSLFYSYYGSIKNLYTIGLTDNNPIWQYREEFPDQTAFHPLLFHDYSVNTIYDTEKFILSRGAGSTIHLFDPTTKKIKSMPKKYSEVFPKIKLESSGFSRFPKTIDLPTSFNHYDADETIKQSNLMFDQSYAHGISVSLRVTGLLEVTCGIPIKLTFKDYTAKTEKSEFKSGNYLISEIDHYFQKDSYKQQIVAIRNHSFVKDSANQI